MNDIDSLLSAVDTIESIEAQTKTADGPGRGRKLCVECKNYVGVRYKECPICQHTFVKGEGKTEDKYSKMAVLDDSTKKVAHTFLGKVNSYVVAPAGDCPVKLCGLDYEDVADWCESVIFTGTVDKKFYTTEALRYYAKQFYDIHSEEYKIVCHHINEWFNQCLNVLE